MKNDKKKKFKLVHALPMVVGAILGVSTSIFKDSLDLEKFFNLKGLLILFLTIIATFLFAINIHEFGHFIFGKILGYKLLSYRIGFLTWNYENGIMKFSIEKNRGYSGLCVMINPDNISLKKQVLYYSGGIILNIISILVFTIFAIIITNFTIKILFIVGLIITLIIVVYNLIPHTIANQPTDGKIIYSIVFKKPISQIILKITHIHALLVSGVRPKDIPYSEVNLDVQEEITIFEFLLIVQNYFTALDIEDTNMMKKYICIIENSINLIPSYTLSGVLHELIYYYSVMNINNEKAVEYYGKTSKLLLKSKDINGLRVKCAYEFYINKDTQKALEYANNGLAVFDKYPIKGHALMEKNLIEKTLKIMLSENQ